MKRIVLAVFALAAVSARADLSKIDADGVTETGGSAAYAHMLPRTGADGRLSASLLPPAGLEAQPIPRMYYVSGAASSQGNGSALNPFNTLEYAASQVVNGSALVLAPNTYSGSLYMSAGRKITLAGTGMTVLSHVTVSVTGNSADTELDLFGVSVGTLHVTGGRIRIRLMGSTVVNLTGSASPVSLIRADMGSTVTSNTLGASDTYSGYDTVAKAASVVVGSDTMTLARSGGSVRAVVGSDKIAYLSDVYTATNAVHADIVALSNADIVIHGRIDAEAATRLAEDLSLSNDLTVACTNLEKKIERIGENWSTQMSAMNTSISTVGSSLAQLKIDHTNDVHNLELAVEAAKTKAETDDGTLSATLKGYTDTEVASLRSDVSSIAYDVANTRITARKSEILDEAYAAAQEYTDDELSDYHTETVAKIDERVVKAEATIKSHTSSISALGTKDGELNTKITNLGTELRARCLAIETRVTTIESWKTTATSDISAAKTSINTHKAKINAIIDCLSSIKAIIGEPAKDLVIPPKL